MSHRVSSSARKFSRIHLSSRTSTSRLFSNPITAVSGTNAMPGLTPQSALASSYAKVHHRKEYEEAMDGRHGHQLELAWKEAANKSDRNKFFDPFEHYKVIPTQEEDEEEEVNDSNEALDTPDSDAPLEDNALLDEENPYYDDDNEEEEEDPTEVPILKESMKRYNHDGSLKLPHATKAAYTAGAPAGGKFAIVTLANCPSQHKVSVDDVIIFNKLKPVHKWSVGSVHTLSSNDNGNVLLVGDKDATHVGLPYVEGAEVDVMVEEITRDQTVLVFAKKRRKNHRRKNGFRRQVTFLRVLDIRVPLEEKACDGQEAKEDLVA